MKLKNEIWIYFAIGLAAFGIGQFAKADHMEADVKPFAFHEGPVPICVDREIADLANAHMGYVLVRETLDGSQLWFHERTGNVQIVEPSAEILGQVCLVASGNPNIEE